MKNLTIILALAVLCCVACQRIDTPYGGIADLESDKTALQPDPGRAE